MSEGYEIGPLLAMVVVVAWLAFKLDAMQDKLIVLEEDVVQLEAEVYN